MYFGEFEIRNNRISSYKSNSAHVVIPEGIIGFCDSVFEDKKEIRTIELPSTFKSIEGWQIDGCNGIEDIVINHNNPYIVNINGCIYSKDGGTLIFYPPYLCEETFEIPEFVYEIGEEAFYHSSVKKIICSSGLKKINKYAFYCCPKLSEIIISDTVSEIHTESFYDCSALAAVKLPQYATLIIDR